MITGQNHFENPDTMGFQQRLPGMTGDVTAALIGPEGGIVRVTDPGSILFGTTLRIPPGALDTFTWIQIEKGEHGCPFGLGPSVKITPEGLVFKRPAEIDMRIAYQSVLPEEVEPSFYVYDESNTDWVEKHGHTRDPESGVFRCRVWHL